MSITKYFLVLGFFDHGTLTAFSPRESIQHFRLCVFEVVLIPMGLCEACFLLIPFCKSG